MPVKVKGIHDWIEKNVNTVHIAFSVNLSPIIGGFF